MTYEAKWGAMVNAGEQFGKCSSTIKSVYGQVNQIKNTLHLTGSPLVLQKIKSELQKCVTSLDACAAKTALMKNLLVDSANTYKANEKKLSQQLTLDFNVSEKNAPSSLWNFLTGKENFSDSYSLMQLTGGGFALSLLAGTKSLGMESGKGKIKTWKPDEGRDFKTFYQKNADTKFAEEGAGVSIYGVRGKAEGSLLEGSYTGENASVSAKLGNAEAHWNADAGLYQYDKNGNKFVSPRVSAEVGMSASLATAEAKGNYQFNDNLGVQGKAEVNFGKVEAKGQVKSVLFDKDGKFKPEVKGSLSAEAIGAEAKGSAGISVGGVEANLTGKVGVGIGAHADVGWVDGKLKVDIGAYMGVGGSIGFDVDIGGAVDAVAGKAKAVWDWATGWW